MSGVRPGVRVLDRKLIEERAYWINKLSLNYEPSNIRLDHPRPVVYSASKQRVEFVIDGELFSGIKNLVGDGLFLLYTTLTAALKICLYKYTGNNIVVVGSPSLKLEDNSPQPANMLVIIDDLRGDASFRQLLMNTRQALLEAYERQSYPLENLINDFGLKAIDNRCPLFEITVSLADIHAEVSEVKSDMNLTFAMAGDHIKGTFDFNDQLYERSSVERFISHFKNMAQAALDNTSNSIDTLDMTSAGERQKLTHEWNHTATPYPSDTCFHKLFEAQARMTPGALAAVFDREQLSYSELNVKANSLARYLRKAGVDRDVLVGLFVDRSLEMLAGLLGIMKAGGAYVPLDPAHPKERLAFMLADTAAPVILTERHLLEKLPQTKSRIICLDTDWPEIAAESGEDLDIEVYPENIAYLIYTSGSTGQPKGVLIAHRGLCNLSEAQLSCFGVKPENRLLQFASLTFDASIFEIAMGLRAGASLYFASLDSVMPGPRLARLLAENKISNVTLPPSVLAALPDSQLPDLKTIIVAGEACSARLVSQWEQGRRFFNAYGPTETTVWASLALCANGSTAPPIGRPIPNVRIYLLDPNLRPVPPGVPGELHIGGPGLARGYLNRPDLTAEKFIPDPFSGLAAERLYKTGDLARYLPDGNIEFLGRIDHQVKINGLRIELGEVEVVLSNHPAVREAVVMAREDARGENRLVAYIEIDGRTEPSTSELRAYIKEKLPDYMIPSAFVILDAFPLTSNGKVDRRALPAPDNALREFQQDRSVPRNIFEEMLAGVWAKVLGTDEVGIHANFFELGGNSILATQVTSRISESFQVELPLRSIFESPTVAQLAGLVEQMRAAESNVTIIPVETVSRQAALPLSFAQQRLWFLHQLEPDSPAYNMFMAFRLSGKLDTPALERAINEIIRRHEALRTTFEMVNDAPVQVINAALPFSLPVSDLRSYDRAEREAASLSLATDEARASFNLESGPLLKAKLIRLEDEEHVMTLNMHHIVSDGWSLTLFVRELTALYAAFSQGKLSPLAELPIQYADFAAWQRRWLQDGTLEKQLSYWKKRLEGELPRLELDTDRERLAQQTFKGAAVSFALSPDTATALKSLCRNEGVTMFMALLAAFKILLYRYTGQEDILVGSAVANRDRTEFENIIGCFINTQVLRSDLSGNPTFLETIARVREVVLDAYAHQSVPFEMIVETLQPERKGNYNPLFQVWFVLHSQVSRDAENTELKVNNINVDIGTAQFDLTLSMHEGDESVAGSFTYNLDLFDKDTIEEMSRRFVALVNAVAANASVRLLDICLDQEGESGSVDKNFDVPPDEEGEDQFDL